MLKKSALTFSVLSEFIKKPLTFWHSSLYFGNFRSPDDKIDFKKHNECEAKLKKKDFLLGWINTSKFWSTWASEENN